MDKQKGLNRQMTMTALYTLLALWFLFAAYTEYTGKWVTFPASAVEATDEDATQPEEEEKNDA